MPAAAVIPAPIAYIKIVAVKTLVVGNMRVSLCPSQRRIHGISLAFVQVSWLHFIVRLQGLDFYFEEIRVFQAGSCREYDSME